LLRRQEGDTTEEGANSVALLTPLQRQERDLIIDALRRTDDNVVQAAALLHMGQATVYRKIRLYQIAHTRRRRKRV
jgi:transcriptional regulator of acetoin/glycerol metabolism